MNLKKLNPWNWFKHEEKEQAEGAVPVHMSPAQGAGKPALQQDLHPVLRMHQEMNRLFDEMFQAFSWPGGNQGVPAAGRDAGIWSAFRPSIDVSGDEERYEITLDVPGFKESELDISLQDDVLVIRGKKETEHAQNDKHYYRVERQYGEFRRVLNLPEDAAHEAIRANLKDGVLRLEIPRTALPEPVGKRIEIEH